MIPFVARNLFCRLHEALLRRPTFRYLGELEQSQWDSPDALLDLQRRKLRALLMHAASRLPFYRTRFREAGVDLESTDSFDTLRCLPLVTKSDMHRHVGSMLWRESPGGVHSVHTGGSTGEPLAFYVDRRRQACDQAARARTHRWFGVQLGDREAYLWGSPIEPARTDALKRFRDRLFNHDLLDAFDMSPARMDAYLDRLRRIRPVCLFGYPSSLALLSEHALGKGRTWNEGSLRAVFVTGEVCFPHHREVIGEYFQVPVADGYGAREAGFIAHQCPVGSMHVMAEHVIVEIVEKGRAVPPGESGEIVVTHLDAYAMPFIRYRTGDRGRLLPGRCACGRGLPRMDVIQGRATDFLYLPDGTVKHALSVIYPLRAMSGIRRFRVHQDENYGVRVEVVRDDRSPRVTREGVCDRVRLAIGDRVALSVDFVDHIAPAGSGKYRYVSSEVKAADKVPAEMDEKGGLRHV